MLQVGFGRCGVWIVWAIKRAKSSVACYAALEFFGGLLGDRLLERISATMGQHRADDAKDDGEGFQVPIIMGLIGQCKNRK